MDRLKAILAKLPEDSENVEIELKFHYDSNNWLLYYENLKPNIASIKESISIIKKDDRKEIFFNNGKKEAEIMLRKIAMGNVYYRNCKISVNIENNLGFFDINSATMIRIKLRSSFVLDSLPDWRWDFTIVKVLDPSNFQNVNKFKDAFFKKENDFVKRVSQIQHDMRGEKDLFYELEVEYIGKLKLININEIDTILSLLGNTVTDDYQSVIYGIASKLLGSNAKPYKTKYNLKHLANQPINFNQKIYIDEILPHIDEYFLSTKADGERVFVIITDKIKLITSSQVIDFADKSNEYFTDMTILDAEYMNDKRVYAFDCLMINGFKITQLNMAKREKKLDEAITHLSNIQKKPLERLTKDKFPEQIKSMYESDRLFQIDGLIFTPNFAEGKDNYFDMVVWKWKPPHLMTIDFLVVKLPQNMVGIKPYIKDNDSDIYLLFCGIKHDVYKSLGLTHLPFYNKLFEGIKFNNSYFPIHFTPVNNNLAYIYYHKKSDPIKGEDLHMHIAEFGYECPTSNNESSEKKSLKNDEKNVLLVKEYNAIKKCHWKLIRLRKDRDVGIKTGTSYGNDFKVAESTFVSYQNPFTIDELVNPDLISKFTNNYFKSTKKKKYQYLTKFNNFVKAQLIRQLEFSNFVIDLGSGKGQDLFIYNGFNIKNMLFIDIDKKALIELNERKYLLDKAEYYLYNTKPAHNMQIFVKELDLTKKNLHILDDFPIKKANGVVINFAIHYLIFDQQSLNNFIEMVDSLLESGGLFIFTCFDGYKIIELLQDIKENETWNLFENDEIKYSIKKLYSENTLEHFGQKIDVLHPFSENEYYTENLINIDYLLQEFKKNGFMVRQNGSFADWLPKYQKFSKQLYDSLTQEDKLYSSLYSYVSLFKS